MVDVMSKYNINIICDKKVIVYTVFFNWKTSLATVNNEALPWRFNESVIAGQSTVRTTTEEEPKVSSF